MSNFKIGDRVKVISNVDGSGEPVDTYVGKVGVITQIAENSSFPYRLDLPPEDSLGRLFRECDLVSVNTVKESKIGKSKPSETFKPSIPVKTVVLATFAQALDAVLNWSCLMAMRRDGSQFMARNKEGVVMWYSLSDWSGNWVELYPVKVSSRNNKDQFEMINRSEFFKSKGNV